MSKRTKIFPYVIILIYLCFNVFFVLSQETYNNCNQAIDLCPNQVLNANNLNANKTLCVDCEDDDGDCDGDGNDRLASGLGGV